MARTLANIISDMKAFIKSKYVHADTGEGTILSDVVIEAPARELQKVFTELEIIARDQSLITASSVGLLKYGSNYNLIKKAARPARGIVIFFTRTAPTSDIVIPAGTIVGTTETNFGESVQFSTVQSVAIYAALSAIYLNITNTTYEISVAVEATVGGRHTNVGAYAINSIVSSLSGIVGCYNVNATSGGSDTESDTAYAARIAARIAGNNIGTHSGILTQVLGFSKVESAIILAHGNSLRGSTGAVDVLIKGVDLREKVEVYTEVLSTIKDIFLQKTPVRMITSVFSSASGSLSLSNYSFVPDTGIYKGSIYARDKLMFTNEISGDGIPTAEYGTIYIKYLYNGLIHDIQNAFALPERNLLNTDILIQEATEILIDLICQVRLEVGFDSTDVVNDIENELVLFFSELGIGAEVQQATVVQAIMNVPGVHDVSIPFTTFQSADSTIVRDSNGNLSIPSTAYAAAGTITINIMTQ